MRTTFLPFALPDVDHTELTQIQEALASGWVTTGPKTRQFEAEFAAAVGAKHAIAVNSCTAAMLLPLDFLHYMKKAEKATGDNSIGSYAVGKNVGSSVSLWYNSMAHKR